MITSKIWEAAVPLSELGAQMQRILDRAYRGRDRPDADAFDETECNGAIDGMRELAHKLGIEGLK